MLQCFEVNDIDANTIMKDELQEYITSNIDKIKKCKGGEVLLKNVLARTVLFKFIDI